MRRRRLYGTEYFAEESGREIKPGDKIYAVNMNKCLVMYQIGKKPMKDGMNILGAHIDSPRIDVKQNPL